MRILLKIVTFPIVTVLLLFSWAARLILGFSSMITNFIAGAFFLLAIVCLVMSVLIPDTPIVGWKEFGGMLFVSFFFSPFGLMGIVGFIVDRIDDLNGMLMSI